MFEILKKFEILNLVYMGLMFQALASKPMYINSPFFNIIISALTILLSIVILIHKKIYIGINKYYVYYIALSVGAALFFRDRYNLLENIQYASIMISFILISSQFQKKTLIHLILILSIYIIITLTLKVKEVIQLMMNDGYLYGLSVEKISGIELSRSSGLARVIGVIIIVLFGSIIEKITKVKIIFLIVLIVLLMLLGSRSIPLMLIISIILGIYIRNNISLFSNLYFKVTLLSVSMIAIYVIIYRESLYKIL